MESNNNHRDNALKTISKGTLIFLIGLFLAKLLGYIFRIVVARIGANEYGLFSIALAVIGVFTAIAVFGMDNGVLRYIAYYREKKDFPRLKGVLFGALKVTSLLSVIFMVLIIVFADRVAEAMFHNASLAIILKILALMLTFDSVRSIFLYATRAFKQIKYETYAKGLIEGILKVLLSALFIFLGMSLIGIAVANVLAVLISLLYLVYFFNSAWQTMKYMANQTCARSSLFPGPFCLTA